jgi:hypothetical protein
LQERSREAAVWYICPLGYHYFLKTPFPIYVMEEGSCQRVIDSLSEDGKAVLLNGEGVTYAGITDAGGMEVKNIDIVSVLKSLKEFFSTQPEFEYLIEPIEWHIKNFESI